MLAAADADCGNQVLRVLRYLNVLHELPLLPAADYVDKRVKSPG